MKLIQGDCINEMNKLIDENIKVDLVLTDLPYGTTQCKWDNIIPFNEMWDCLKLLVDENTPILFFATQPFSSCLVNSNIKGFKYEWIWQKEKGTGFQIVKHKPLQDHEHILVFTITGKRANYYPIKTKRDKPVMYSSASSYSGSSPLSNLSNFKHISTGKYPKTTIKFSRDSNRIHPTQKPVALLEYLIKTYSNDGDTVLDFTMGSGSTGVACRNTNRDFIGIELDEEYYNIAKKRIFDNQARLI